MIEVATFDGDSTKAKGDLLEKLIAELVSTQGYIPEQQIRKTGVELDLLCTHKVTQRRIYVECKAHRDPLSSDALKQLAGVVFLNPKKYSEGWLVTTGPLGKDAKGLKDEWENQAPEEKQKIVIYTPERIVEALTDSRVIKKSPDQLAMEFLKSDDVLGEWLLLISPMGYYWLATCLEGGMPKGVLAFSAKTGDLIDNQEQLVRLTTLDTSFRMLDFCYIQKLNVSMRKLQNNPPAVFPQVVTEMAGVVEVQYGESWSDYRPARPEHFVGRQEAQKEILQFFKSVRNASTKTRVFAIKGDSGMGKSSLIAKVRESVRRDMYKDKYYLYAVDLRAATDTQYITWSLLNCLRESAKLGFGTAKPELLSVSNPSNPLLSESFKDFFVALENKKQVVCLVFDQFEEFYSKPELFHVFKEAQQLLSAVTAQKTNFIIGFAWKTDVTVHIDHPGYHFWHSLADWRMEISLGPLLHADTTKAIKIFEAELEQQLRPDLRRQLIENSQGYPWLLKKLCIHVFDQIHSGLSQSELIGKALDVRLLFDKDIQNLSEAEHSCLKTIAQNAPADWYKTLEIFDHVLLSLIQKRLVVRSGNRINLYWDIFREYVTTNKVPSIPLTYLPSSSITSLLKVAEKLSKEESLDYSEISRLTGLRENTSGNVLRDLIMFGIAVGSQASVKLDPSVTSSNQRTVLMFLRKVFANHALTLHLIQNEAGNTIAQERLIVYLKSINPAAQHNDKTWKVYAKRMVQWLSATGYLLPSKDGWKCEDQGEINLTPKKPKTGEVFFIGDAPPEKAIEAISWLSKFPAVSGEQVKAEGYRNAIAVLRQLGALEVHGRLYSLKEVRSIQENIDIIVDGLKNITPITWVLAYLGEHPDTDGKTLGAVVNQAFNRGWSSSSELRIGRSLLSWAELAKEENVISSSRKKKKLLKNDQPSLFD